MDLSDETKPDEGGSSELGDESLSGEYSSEKTDDSLSLCIAESDDEISELPPELPRFRSLLPARGDSNQKG